MYRIFIILIISLTIVHTKLGYSTTSYSTDTGFDTDQIINDPSISLRCKEILKNRQEKMTIAQRLNDLMKRGEKALLASERGNRTTTKSQLELSMIKIKQEHRLINLKIKVLEENLVRQGCPGILL